MCNTLHFVRIYIAYNVTVSIELLLTNPFDFLLLTNQIFFFFCLVYAGLQMKMIDPAVLNRENCFYTIVTIARDRYQPIRHEMNPTNLTFTMNHRIFVESCGHNRIQFNKLEVNSFFDQIFFFHFAKKKKKKVRKSQMIFPHLNISLFLSFFVFFFLCWISFCWNAPSNIWKKKALSSNQHDYHSIDVNFNHTQPPPSNKHLSDDSDMMALKMIHRNQTILTGSASDCDDNPFDFGECDLEGGESDKNDMKCDDVEMKMVENLKQQKQRLSMAVRPTTLIIPGPTLS